MRMVPALVGPAGLALAVLAAHAAPPRASAQDLTGSRAAPEANDFAGTDGEESPELRSLRLLELELFGPARPLVDASATPFLAPGEPPGLLTSDAPQAPEARATGRTDLSWLQGLDLPDIPIRWDAQVIRYLEFYRSDPRGRSIVGAWLRRAARWAPMVRAELRSQGLPEDLLYVAMTESGFDPRARSDAGAVGMWQFVRGTGAEYGLRIDHWVDERMDPERSTGAGARYLAHLQRRFGSWELAFAAYNMGYGALLRAMRKYNTNDYWVLSELEAGLPFETTFYVAKIMACAIVGRNPARFGFAELEPEVPLRYDRVEVPAGTPLAQVASAAGVTPTELSDLNPHLRRNRLPPGGERVSVRIPDGRALDFARRFARLSPRNPAHQPYVARFGDTVESIARRFGTTAAGLRSLNELDEAQRIAVGLELLVPAVAPRQAPAEERPVVAIPERFVAAPGRRRVFYRVAEGDTIASVAGFFEVTQDELRGWNNVEPSAALQPGIMLQLFVPPRVDLSRALVLGEDEVRLLVVGSQEFFDYHEAQRGRVRFRYTVRPGDTLASLARHFDLSVGSIARINRFARTAALQVGQQIIVYAPRDRVPAAVLAEIDARMGVTGAATPSVPAQDDGEGDEDAARSDVLLPEAGAAVQTGAAAEAGAAVQTGAAAETGAAADSGAAAGPGAAEDSGPSAPARARP